MFLVFSSVQHKTLFYQFTTISLHRAKETTTHHNGQIDGIYLLTSNYWVPPARLNHLTVRIINTQHHDYPRQRYCQSLFCSTMADTEHATFTVKGRFADAASCTRRQQSRLLQHSAGWDLRITPWSTPVSAECCCKVVRTRDSTSPRPSLVESPGENQVPSLCSDALLSTWHRAAVSRRDPATDIRHVYTSPSPVFRPR